MGKVINMANMLGVMLDCSRNAVLKVETIKRYADIIKKMGYNTLMLYTEDTYEIESQPYFGHLRGRYTKQELKEIDAYCNEIGLELVPCIQTLAHLATMFKWQNEYDDINDIDGILLCGAEKTYKLIDDMFATIYECFTSRKIHIGMDEANRLGTGKYHKINGTRDRFDIINEHLHKVCDLAKKYNFEPIIWHDMFYRLAANVDTQYDEANVDKLLEKAQLPENISLMFWEYFSKDADYYKGKFDVLKLFGRNISFAGTARSWEGFAPLNKYSIDVNSVSIKACKDNGIDDVLITVWGDDGSETPHFAVLPTLFHAAEVYRGNNDMNSIKAKFKEITGCGFDDILDIEKLDEPDEYRECDPSKYMLYNDVFLGQWDYRCKLDDDKYYADLANKLRNKKDVGEFGYIFDMYAALADVLAIKCSYGVKLRKSYKDKDIDSIKMLISDGKDLLDRLERFYNLYQERWFKDNKPHGFEIQDIRLGGLMHRIKSCIVRLEKLVSGEIAEIPELNEPVLDKFGGHHYWGTLVSQSVITNKV